MSTNEINSWCSPPVPQVVQEALKDYPEIIAEIKHWFSRDEYAMHSSLDLDDRIGRLEWTTIRLKDGLGGFYSTAKSQCNRARVSGDDAALTVAEKELRAIGQARNADVEIWDELEAFYGLIRKLGQPYRIKKGA